MVPAVGLGPGVVGCGVHLCARKNSRQRLMCDAPGSVRFTVRSMEVLCACIADFGCVGGALRAFIFVMCTFIFWGGSPWTVW